MRRALSLDLRERVIAANAAGASCRQAAERFSVGPAIAICWHGRFRKKGQVAAKPMGADPCSPCIAVHAAFILQTSAAQPQAYLRELRDQPTDLSGGPTFAPCRSAEPWFSTLSSEGSSWASGERVMA
jgi:transposase